MSKQEIIEIGPSAPAGALATQTAAPLAGRDATIDPMLLLQSAMEKGYSPEAIAQFATTMAELKTKMDDRAARKYFNQAMLSFKEEVPVVVKRRCPTQGPQYNYAAIEDIEDVITPVLVKHGLSYRFPESLGTSDKKMRTTIRISHVSGHFEDTTVELPIPDMRVNETQKAAAAISYGRRYCLCSALGLRLAGHDNDGSGLNQTSESFHDATNPITIEQANELNTLGSELKIDKAQWLKRASENIGRPVREWIDLPQSEYLKVRSAMMTKKQAAKA